MCVGFSEGVDIDKGEPEIRNLQGFFKCWYLTANKFPTGYIQNETVRDFFFSMFLPPVFTREDTSFDSITYMLKRRYLYSKPRNFVENYSLSAGHFFKNIF